MERTFKFFFENGYKFTPILHNLILDAQHYNQQSLGREKDLGYFMGMYQTYFSFFSYKMKYFYSNPCLDFFV